MSRPLRSLVPVVVATVALALVVPAGPASAQATVGSAAPGTGARLSVPLLSARRVPDLVRAPIADRRLRQQVEAIVADAPPTSCVRVTVHGRPSVDVNGALPLEPASVNKLATADAVFQVAKPDEKLVTLAVAAKAPAGGVVDGDLWLVGGGDALLTTPGYRVSFRDQEQTIVDFGLLADHLRAAGVTRIQGDIVGDESRYDTERGVPTWPGRYQIQETVGPLSALLVNDGVTGFDRTPDRPTTLRRPGDPAVLAAGTLKSLLEQRGIDVTGGVRSGPAPRAAVEVARLEERTVADEVAEMLGWSDNTTAELLTKEIGRRAKAQGSTAAGTQAILEILRDQGLPTAGVTLADGSGLDEGNRLTCQLVTAVLDRHGPTSPLARGLPVAGQRGTLLPRMRRAPLEGNVVAKTGTLTSPPVLSLAGFVRTHENDVVTFAFLQNGPKLDQQLQDRLADALVAYPEAPDLTGLVPPATSRP